MDIDNDGIGDVCDPDVDADGVDNSLDNCPLIPNSGQEDFDLDTVGDACDLDIDEDGVLNANDICEFTIFGDLINSNGCSIHQLCPCDAPFGSVIPWKSFGEYNSCLNSVANDFVIEGLIIPNQKSGLAADAKDRCNNI